MYAIQDKTKLSGNNLLDTWGEEFDAEPHHCMTFESYEEAKDYTIKKQMSNFTSIVLLSEL